VCDGQCDCLQDRDGKCADEIDCSLLYTKTDGMNWFSMTLKILTIIIIIENGVFYIWWQL